MSAWSRDVMAESMNPCGVATCASPNCHPNANRCVFGDQRQVWMRFLIRRMLFGDQRGSRGECRTSRQSNIALLLVSNSGMDVQNDDSGVQIVTIIQALSLGSDVNRIFRAVVEVVSVKALKM
jgi:hypothetical protein